ncbi:MSMEG_6728 family protein [Nonomuraea indica]|uniref:MSMEG_6728 family protein n=1 Tax=Nonomuraea indica TaxID=1581193 RepID=A0ABW7ZWF8_9ACTN|nr:MSMEG_6728 family protein [Nonomuraea indica]
MQTFLPFPDFTRCAESLDPLRLGKQRVEALQILRALTVPGYGWRHHPAVRMWAGYEEALARYGLDVCHHWCSTGRTDTCADTITRDLAARCDRHTVRTQPALAAAGELPPWLGDAALHRSHRSALLRKAPDFYGPLFTPLFGPEPDDLPYVWPPSDRPPACLPDRRFG